MCKDNKKCRRLQRRIVGCLHFVSIGQYNLGLYFNRRLQYSSLIGGLISIAFAMFMVFFTVLTLKSTFNRDEYNTEFRLIKLEDYSKLFDYTLKDLPIYNFIRVNLNANDTSLCDNMNISIVLSDGDLKQHIGNFSLNDSKSFSEISNSTKCYFYPLNNQRYQQLMQNYSDRSAIVYDEDEFYAMSYRLQYQIYGSLDLYRSIYININSSEISQSGNITEAEVIYMFPEDKNAVRVNFQLIAYMRSESLLGIGTGFEENLLVKSDPTVLPQYGQKSYIYIRFKFDSTLIQYKQYPVTILSALIKIGGLFGIIKIVSSCIQYIHRKMFEKRLQSSLLNQPSSRNTRALTTINDNSVLQDQDNLINPQQSEDDATVMSEDKKLSQIQKVYSYSSIKVLIAQMEKNQQRIQSIDGDVDHKLTQITQQNQLHNDTLQEQIHDQSILIQELSKKLEQEKKERLQERQERLQERQERIQERQERLRKEAQYEEKLRNYVSSLEMLSSQLYQLMEQREEKNKKEQ